MSQAQKVLDAIKPGEPVKAETVVARTGLTPQQAGPILAKLCDRGQIVKIERGVYTRASGAPLTPAQMAGIRAQEKRRRMERALALRKAAQARYVAKRREKARLAAEREAAMKKHAGLGLVAANAIASRHPLHAAWGGGNA